MLVYHFDYKVVLFSLFFSLGTFSLSAQSPISTKLDSILSVFEIALNNDLDCAQEEAYSLLQQEDLAFQFLGYYNLSRAFSTLHNIQEEGKSVDTLSHLALQLPEPVFQGLLFLAKANLENKLSRKGKAIYFLGKSITLLAQTQYYRFRVMALRDLGDIYLSLQNSKEAYQYYQQAINISYQQQDHHLVAHFYSEMSTFFEKTQQKKKALYYLQKSDSLNQFVQAKLLKSINLLKWAGIYSAENQSSAALKALRQGLIIVETLENINFTALFNFKIGEVYTQISQYASAIPFFEKSLHFSQEVRNKSLEKANFQYLADVYKKLGKQQAAINYLSALNGAEKAIFNDEQILMAQKFAYKYESQKKEKEIKVLKTENALKDLQKQQLFDDKRQQQKTLFLLSALIILFIILAISFIVNLRQKTKKDALLLQKSKELHLKEIQEIERVSQLKTLNAILKGQEKERERISRDLHDSLGGTLSTLQLHFQNNESLPSPHIDALLAKACTDVREISHNMMPVSLKKLGLQYAIQDYINNINAANQISANAHFFGDEIHLPADTQLSIYRLVQEGVNNAIKHAESTTILVQFIYKDNHVNIVVEDDGKGFEVSKIKHSFGLQNMQNRVEYLSGKMTIDPKMGYGTTLMFEIPTSFDLVENEVAA